MSNKITDIDISFIRWVCIIMKVTIASIPAMVLSGMIIAIISLVFGGLFGSIAHASDVVEPQFVSAALQQSLDTMALDGFLKISLDLTLEPLS